MNEPKAKNKVVVITGASAGVGRATAIRYAKDGASVALLARGINGLESASEEVRENGGKPLAIQVDVSDAEGLESAVERIEKELGPIDIWINNAMVSVFSPVKKMSSEEYRRVTEVTYLGVVNGTLSALKRMLPRDEGVIVQVGSALAYRGIPLQSAYCASKHAIQGFVDSLRCELLHDSSKVHVTMVQLPAMNTPQFEWVKSRLPKKARPVPPIFQPEVAADAIYWSSFNRRRELYVGASTVLTIIADKLFPTLFERYLSQNGYKSQQTDQDEDPNRSDNLIEPVDVDYGVHGNFDDRSYQRSLQLVLTKNRTYVYGVILIILLFILF